MSVSKVEMLHQLRKVTLSIFRTHSMKEMRALIVQELPQLCGVKSISIQEKLSNSQKGTFSVALSSDPVCYILFQRSQPFSQEDKKFLTQISKAVDMNFQKIEKQDQLCFLKEQWKSTFNAIPKPICLTDENFMILSTNKAFMKQISTYDKPPKNIYGKDCFSVFCGSCFSEEEQKKLLKSKIFKKIPHLKSTFEFHCQSFVRHKDWGGVIRLVIFTNRAQQMEMERKVSRLSDQAEMGIIASSIAHELNNPLAGIQALLQVSSVKDLHLQKTMEEMILAVHRCQNIVKHLLTSHYPSPSTLPEVPSVEDLSP